MEEFLRSRRIPFEQEVVTIRQGGEFVDYHHIYLDEDGVEVECSVYPLEDRHRIPRSSITGKPMERANVKRLKGIIEGMVAEKPRSDSGPGIGGNIYSGQSSGHGTLHNG